MGLLPFDSAPSSFLAPEALVQDDAWINLSAAKRLFPVTTPAKNAGAKLLFYWKAWQLVHQHRLKAALQDFVRDFPTPQSVEQVGR